MTPSIKPARRIGPDFCLVELTADGLALAAGHPVTVSNGRITVTVAPGATTKIARYEWDLLLRDHVTTQGKSIFAIAVAEEGIELERQWEATDAQEPAKPEEKE